MKNLLLAVCVLLLIAVPQFAQAETQAFDFLGQADLPTMVGGTLSMYSVIQEGSGIIVPPIPLDFDNYDYTVVITGLVLDVDGILQQYSGGTVTIYEIANGAADYANLSTFTTGTAILVGDLVSMTRSDVTQSFPPFLRAITINGDLDWTSGTRLDDMAPADQVGWGLFASGNQDAANVEPGFDEQWDGKIELDRLIVPSEPKTMGELKAGFEQ
jgi:hypothetical protein